MRTYKFRHALKILALLLLPCLSGCEMMLDRLVSAAVKRQRSDTTGEILSDDAINIFLCGTGSPLPDASSAAACTAVVAGGKLYVIDVGPGSQEVAQLGGLPRASLGGIFLTHFHSDHIGELGEWATQSWLAGRTGPLHIYGPPGVAKVAGGFRQAYQLDDGYRITHHTEEYLPPAATEWITHTVPYSPGMGTVVLEDGDLKVTAFAVDHQPVEPAVGYRFDYKDRSVVISGDTDRSENLRINAEGADVLVHEVLLKKFIGKMSEVFRDAGMQRRGKLSADILDYHTSPAETVALAAKANVDTVVFSHLVPVIPSFLRSWFFLQNVDDSDVDVVIGEDGMRIRLPAGNTEIEIEEP